MAFIANRAFKTELMRSIEMRALLGALVSEAGDAARRLAPKHTGDYASSIVTSVGMREDGLPVGRIASTDFAAHMIEFGSVNNPPYRVLGRAAQSVGLKLVDRGR